MTKGYARWRKQVWLTAFVVGLLALAPGTASAQLIEDPATLQIGPNVGNTSDPVQIGASGLATVTQNSGGVGPLNLPWQLILGIPNAGSGYTAPTITSVNGGATSISGTFKGSLTSASGSTDAYSAAGFLMADTNSNNWTNWSGADQSLLKLNPSSFGLFVYDINASLGAKGTDNIQFSSLPVGTFVIAYGQIVSGTKTTVYDTPFTEAGLETGLTSAVPEPSTIALALSGIVGLGLAGVRRFRQRAAM